MKKRLIIAMLATILFSFLPIIREVDAVSPPPPPPPAVMCYVHGYVWYVDITVTTSRGVKRTNGQFQIYNWKWLPAQAREAFVFVATVATSDGSYVDTLREAQWTGTSGNHVTIKTLMAPDGKCPAWIYNVKGVSITSPYPEQDTDERG